ncbi:MAG: hypothetical protein IPP74_00065 [Alphaproteobacteria bacterium]|nr:hypothetical protein [Alphaproteobacteria bacterium]
MTKKQVWTLTKAFFYIITGFYLVITVVFHNLLPTSDVTFTAIRHRPKPHEDNGQCVILMHGAFSKESMLEPLANAFYKKGYWVLSANYAWNRYTTDQLSFYTSKMARTQCSNRLTHFVVQSSAVILLRHMLEHHPIPNEIGKVVMISPLIKGSELVSDFSWIPGFKKSLGLSIAEMGQDKHDLPAKFSPQFPYPTGAIMGIRSFNPLTSVILPGIDDGLISQISAVAPFYKDSITILDTYTFLPSNQDVIRQTLQFVESGSFDHVLPQKIVLPNTSNQPKGFLQSKPDGATRPSR